jgi:glutamine synthetase
MPVAQGIVAEAAINEFGAGQQEISIRHARTPWSAARTTK